MTDVWNSYGPSAGRRHGATPRPQGLTFDMHAHVAVPAAAKIVEGHLDIQTIPLARYGSPDTKALNQKQEKDRASRMTQYDERLADLDAAGIDQQLVMCPPGQCYYTVAADIAAKAARVVNDGIAEYVAGKPDRFVGFGTVPLQDGAMAAAELDYVVNSLGFKGVQVLTNVHGKELSDPEFAPFWAKAEELGAIVTLHPNGFTEANRLSRFYLNNVVGNPLETTLAIHYLIFDGVMERHPKLKIFAVHGGGFVGAYSARMDHAWGARSDVKVIPHAPTTYLKRMYFDTVVFSVEQLEALVRLVGVDHVFMGTDYPYDMADSDPVGHVMASALDDAAKAAICGGNAKALLGL
ncbi:amidohydrolase family protein [Aquabacter spiritensis]|uniref:Aminocarboxymuconate-semialdehyde decarboxylase n=1 Tax=Aquabacter spiritensis TaxID=933073 RepID=A0A4R3M3S9_9HYPH|nr:amidohydrolase family protein [Aquabacter spiritensis]TCT05977.1 aminocarboxymuconate-semialdehyde decarboxylase [Aquabacter spiritensis]